MVYRGETDEGSSGGAILKAVIGLSLKIVGLHRGGHKDDWDGSGAKGYNYGSLFTEINKSLTEDWNPLSKLLCVQERLLIYIGIYVVMSYNGYFLKSIIIHTYCAL